MLFKHGVSVDTGQLQLKGVHLEGMDFAIVICIFSLVGFESATTLGSEAKRPLRNVPRAVIWSLLITGAFMVFMSYVEVFATNHMGKSLGSFATPLTAISRGLRRQLLQGAGGARGDGELLLAVAVLPERRRAHHLPAGRARLPSEAGHAVHATNMTPARGARLLRGHDPGRRAGVCTRRAPNR